MSNFTHDVMHGMTCPACGAEMERGRLTSGGHRVDWIPEGEKMPFFVWSNSPGVCLIRHLFDSDGIPAFICENCHKVIINY